MKINTPNLIWVFGDQHRGQAMGCAGDPNARTPNLDALAARGCSFPNAVAGNPWCAPFRAALLTGQYNHRHVIRTPQMLDPSLPLVTDAFRAAGYTTAYFGKWHLDGHNQMTYVPRERRGRFDCWIGYENNNAPYDTWVHGHDEQGRDDQEARHEKLSGYETDALTDHLISYLEAPRDRPFFAVLSVQPPHDPHLLPPGMEGTYPPAAIQLRPNVPDFPGIQERARRDLSGYYAQIENLDRNVGRIREAILRGGYDRDTWLIFFSDHGDMHGSHAFFRKSSPWEESIRIPFLVDPPEGETVVPRCSAPLNHVDIAPTSLGLCGIPLPPDMQGRDFSLELRGLAPAADGSPRSAFLQHVHRKRFDCLNRVWRGIRREDGWKYVCLEGQPFGLFNLNHDPYEQTNLAFLDSYNTQREELQQELADWILRTGDEFPLPEL